MLPWIVQKKSFSPVNDGPLVLETTLFGNSTGSGVNGKLEGDYLLFIHQTTTSMMHRSEHVSVSVGLSQGRTAKARQAEHGNREMFSRAHLPECREGMYIRTLVLTVTCL
jgi:hypothetical protein